jgi:hypothetical protein
MKVAASAGRDGSRPEDGAQARVLAELLRGSRITLLLGTRHAAPGAHWAQGLMRQLRRRGADRGRDDPVVLPFEDRRQRRVGPIARCDAEVVVFFDDWGGDPLAGLRARLDRSLAVAGWSGVSTLGPLADTLAGLNQQLGARFLFVFDRFEDFLQADAQCEDVRAFAEQWQRTLDDLTVAANFIVGLSDDAEHLLVRLRERLPKIDRHWVRLEPREPGISAAGEGMPTASNDSTLGDALDAPPPLPPAPPSVAAMSDEEWNDWMQASLARVTAAARVAASAPPGPRANAPMRLEEVYASVERSLERMAQLQRGSARAGAFESGPEPIASLAPAAAPLPLRWSRRRVGATLATLVLMALTVWLGSVVVAPHAPLRSADLPAVEPLTTARLPQAPPPRPAAPAPTAAALPLARVALRVDAEAQRDIAAQLAEQVAAAAQVAIETVPVLGEPDTAAAPADTLALVRYDALQAARKAAPNGPLRIVAPLFTEELHFLVRADSPLRRIHEVRASRINVGPVGSARETTAASAYASLFGVALPMRQADHAGLDDALPALLDGRIDVLVVAAGQPSDWLAGLPAESRAALRPLTLDPRDARSRRALERYLPATLRADSYPGWLDAAGAPTLAVMAFLAAPQLGDGVAAGPLKDVVRALCVQLPVLQRSGHPKWREVQPGLQLNVGWPAAGAAAEAWRHCPPSVVAAKTAGTTSVPPRPEGANR